MTVCKSTTLAPVYSYMRNKGKMKKTTTRQTKYRYAERNATNKKTLQHATEQNTLQLTSVVNRQLAIEALHEFTTGVPR